MTRVTSIGLQGCEYWKCIPKCSIWDHCNAEAFFLPGPYIPRLKANSPPGRDGNCRHDALRYPAREIAVILLYTPAHY